VSTRPRFPEATSPWVLEARDAAAVLRLRAEPLVLPSGFGAGLSVAAMRFAVDDGGERPADWSISVPQTLAQAVPRRRATWLAGRACAAMALQQAGHGTPIPVVGRDARGAPMWPDGFAGSIAHTDGESLAIATTAESLIGVDIERVMTLSTAASVARRIAPEVEAGSFQGAGLLDHTLAVTLAFSAKESVYKCLHPRVQRFFGFEAALVRSIADRVIVVELAEALHESLPAGAMLTLEWATADGVVMTLLRSV
jgi:enterobactin synthetase component D